VAVGALKDGVSPEFPESVDSKQLVDHTRAQEQPARVQYVGADRDTKRALRSRDTIDSRISYFDTRIGRELLPADSAKFVRRGPVASEEVVDVLCGCISSWAKVAEQHAFAGPTERESGREAGRASSCYDDVVRHLGSPH
jgi:hypothetical protein